MKGNPFLYINVLLLIASLMGCAVSNDPARREIKALQKGDITEDTSYVYSLPYEKGESHLLVQGYYSSYSHKNRAALDFKMKKGTTITAARGGVVTRVKEDGTKGGWNRKYRSEGNMVVIQHADGSRAGYWHLQFNGALVNVGDTVKEGQPIGISGKTGYTLFPHLHFLVWHNKKGSWQPVGTRFKTSKGIRYLRPFRNYSNSK